MRRRKARPNLVAWIALSLLSGVLVAENQGPVSVSVYASLVNGGRLPKIEAQLIQAIGDLGYPIVENPHILAEGEVVVVQERQVRGFSPRFLIGLELSLHIKDAKTGEILDSASATANAVGSSGEEAMRKGLAQLRIDPGDLADALAGAQEYMDVRIEAARKASRQSFEEGKDLFESKRYREALQALLLVGSDSDVFPDAQRLIQDIRLAIPKPVIAVTTFQANSPVLANKLRDRLIQDFVQFASEEVTIIERYEISQILREYRFDLEGVLDPFAASELGKLVGAQALLLGRLTVSRDKIQADTRLSRTDTGTIVAAVRTEVDFDELDRAVYDIVSGVLDAVAAGKLDPPQPELPDVLPNTPRTMIIIPETHMSRRVPDPAAETEMVRQFLLRGFRVVDQTRVNGIRHPAGGKWSVDAAVQVAAQHGAEVVIVGEAFSESVARFGFQVQTSAARVEVRAIDVATGDILAADGKEARARDATEWVAGKKALRSASALLVDGLIQTIMSKWKRPASTPREIDGESDAGEG